MANSYVPVKSFAHQLDCHPATIWRQAKNDPKFPKPVKIGRGMTRWAQAEIDAYLAKCAAAREAA